MANSDNTTPTSQETFFLNSDKFNPYRNIDPVGILEFIKKNSPVTMWDITKEREINKNTLYYLIRDLELTGVIKTRVTTNKNNRVVRLVYYNKKSNSLKTTMEQGEEQKPCPDNNSKLEVEDEKGN